MNASLPDFLRRAKSHLRATLLVAAITLAVGAAWAQTRIDPNGVNVSGSVIGDDVLYSCLLYTSCARCAPCATRTACC